MVTYAANTVENVLPRKQNGPLALHTNSMKERKRKKTKRIYMGKIRKRRRKKKRCRASGQGMWQTLEKNELKKKHFSI